MRPLYWRFPIALTILLALAGPRPASAEEEGVTADTILFGQAAALAGPSSALGQGMRHGILAAFEQVNAAGRHSRPQAQARQPRRRLRSGSLAVPDQAAARAGQGVRPDRSRRHADRDRDDTALQLEERAVHRSVHRRRVSPLAGPQKRHQHSRELQRRGGGVDPASHRRPALQPDRHLLSGRFLRPRWPEGRQARAGKARPRTGGRRHLRAQHQGRQLGATDHQARRTRSGGHGRHLRALRRVHQAGAQT